MRTCITLILLVCSMSIFAQQSQIFCQKSPDIAKSCLDYNDQVRLTIGPNHEMYVNNRKVFISIF